MIDWQKWNEKTVTDVHGDVYFYRQLYDGKHAEIFPRAKNLIKQGDVIDIIVGGAAHAKNVQTSYIIANVSKLVAEVPATLITRSIGPVTTSLKNDPELNDDVEEQTDDMIEAPEDQEGFNAEILNLQQELIDQVVENSELPYEHWGNIVQNQVDGGLVGVPRLDSNGRLKIEFKSRDVYFPHEDGKGIDLAYDRKIGGEHYLHVYRERVEDTGLISEHMLFHRRDGSEDLERLSDDEAMALLDEQEIRSVWPGRTRPFIEYWPNQKTFMHPLGISSLKNQEGKQDEINWTLTRSALTFERNGKPRIAVSQQIFRELQNKAFERYGNEDVIDHRDLEIVAMDEQGNAMEIIQIDTEKIGQISWVKDLIKLMLMETQTSEKAVDFYMDSRSAEANSGIAKFYDLFVSIVKSEQLRSEYLHFLKQLFKNCLWMAAQTDDAVRIEEPDIQTLDMVPISGKETAEQNVMAYEKGTQSLETTVRRMNPEASEDWIQEEVARIENGGTSDDSTSLLSGRSILANYLDNPDSRGQAGAQGGAADEEGGNAGAADGLLAAPGTNADMPALNGAQITSVLAVIEQVKSGAITVDQGRALLVDGLKLAPETAARIIV